MPSSVRSVMSFRFDNRNLSFYFGLSFLTMKIFPIEEWGTLS